ncbi:MAG: T9SS type A sorting domain-containing protein [Flavobacteriales bacterium]|nr:T9SS type A sorting domain-containing protein [Flavobacteriales bacterium]
MNHRYLLLSTLLVAGTCIAQSSRELRYAMQHDEGTLQQAPPAAGALKAGGDVIFSEDWANGFAGNNGVGAWTVSGPNGNIWKRTLTGPVGSFSVPAQKITSTTVANGFAAFYSDSANCNCTSGAGNWPATPTEWDGALESPVLDLSATPNVLLQWEQRLRWCCQATSPHAVEISTDGGLTWPTTLEAASGISTNNDPGTQTRQIILISAIAPNPAQVKFRFKHNPTAAAYHWQIDDIKIIELYDNDIKMVDGYLSQTGDGEEYGRTPSDQFEPTMLIGSTLSNFGSQEQTNVVLTADVTGPVPFVASTTLSSLAIEGTAAAELAYTLPALLPGNYSSAFSVAADTPDENPGNNTFLRNFQVNDCLYSLDGIGIHPAAVQSLGTLGSSSFTGAADGLVLLDYYQVNNPLTVYGIEIALGSTTVAGGYVIAHLRDTTPVFAVPAQMTTVIAETDPVDVTAPVITAGLLQLYFTNPVVLSPNGYFASVSLFSNAGAAHIRVIDDLTVPQPGTSSAIFIPNDQLYSNGNAVAVRMITAPGGSNCTTGVDEQTPLMGISIYPNPSNGRLTIRTEEPGNYTIDVLDLLGQTVMSRRALGTTTLDLAGQAEGMYMVRVSNGTSATVQRVTLSR